MRTHVFRNLSLLIALALTHGALAAVRKTELPVLNRVISPDGFSRDAVLAGGTFPGPLISGNKGDNFQINVNDQLTNTSMDTDVSIHWHGIFQHHTNWADGVAFVTQCPIIPGNSFLHNFTIPDQAGTYWYHSHYRVQYCDGLRGPLVVYDPNDPHKDLYDVDDESTVITLADWYHVIASTIVPPAFPDSTLINGLGRWSQNPTSELAVIKVTQGKRYRFRLVSISCDPNFMFSIDGHTMTVIEADGENTQPLLTDQIQIFAAQRYSFVLNANQTVGNYWIRAAPNLAVNNALTFDGGINSAILRYEGAPEEEPTTPLVPSRIPLVESNLHPLTNPAAPGQPINGAPDVVPIRLDIGFANGSFSINGAVYVSPELPVLLQILNGNLRAQDLLPAGSVYVLPRNKTIEVNIPPSAVGGPHPFHLHGHTFSVVRSAGQEAPNYIDPPRRDTVNIGNDIDNVTFRFNTNNPGPWFLHCHIDFHLNTGLAVVFAEDTPDIAPTTPVPQAWTELCPEYYAAKNAST